MNKTNFHMSADRRLETHHTTNQVMNASSKHQAFGLHPSLHLSKVGVSEKPVSEDFCIFFNPGYSSKVEGGKEGTRFNPIWAIPRI